MPGRPERIRIDGKWTAFLFGGLTTDSLRDALEAWLAWAASGAGPAPIPAPRPDELVGLWILLEALLGAATCLLTAAVFAVGSSVGGISVLGSLLCFAILSLLLTVPTVVTLGTARVRAHALAWLMAWIAFAFTASWVGHLAAAALYGLRAAER